MPISILSLTDFLIPLDLQKAKARQLSPSDSESEEDTASESDENKHYIDKVAEMMSSRKVNSQQVIRDMMVPGGRLRIPLCRMIPMPVVRPALYQDIKKLQNDFVHGYREGAQVFYVSTTNNLGKEAEVTPELRQSWSEQWQRANIEFEEDLCRTLTGPNFKGKMFFVWDGNHRLQAWFAYINRLHAKDFEKHVRVDSIILDPKDDIAQLMTAMHDVNK